jgi:hypothetical protein
MLWPDLRNKRRNASVPQNSLLAGTENQGLQAGPFREPLMHPVGHPLQLLASQRVCPNVPLTYQWPTGPRTNCSPGTRMPAGLRTPNGPRLSTGV